MTKLVHSTMARWSSAGLMACVGLSVLLMSAGYGGDWHSFTVTRNVNSKEAPVEKVVIFAKGGKHDHIVLSDPHGVSTLGFTGDGAIEAKLTGNKETRPSVSWKAGEGRPESIDPTKYNYLIIRFALEGEIKRTWPDGRVTRSRPGNLWGSFAMYDKEGQRTVPVNPATLTEDQNTPKEIVTVRIPTVLFTRGATNDVNNITSIAFMWGSTHAYNDREGMRLVIERISFAD